MKHAIGRAKTCLGKFGCILLSRILHNSNEGGQVRACPGKYKYIYVWIFENGVNVDTTTLTLFQKIHRIFPSINHRQSVNTQPTHPPCFCLTGWLSAAKPTGNVWPRLTCKEKQHFH